MAKAKKYDINSFERLCNLVNNENAERLATDLALWLLHYNDVISEVRKRNPEETKNLKNTEIAECSFYWIDDKKHEIKKAILINKETGETKDIKL